MVFRAFGMCLVIALFGASAHVDDSAAQELPVSYEISNGQAHPDFILPGIQDGKPVRLSDFRGKKVLLVHFASW